MRCKRSLDYPAQKLTSAFKYNICGEGGESGSAFCCYVYSTTSQPLFAFPHTQAAGLLPPLLSDQPTAVLCLLRAPPSTARPPLVCVSVHMLRALPCSGRPPIFQKAQSMHTASLSSTPSF